MTGDRRSADERRSKEDAADRRKKNDRRYASSRRGAAEKNADASSGKKKKQVRKKQKRTIDWASVFKKTAAGFVILMSFFMFAVIYFFAHLDHHMVKVGQRIKVKLEKATLDPQSITDRQADARLNFRIENTLPLDVIVQSVSYSVNLGGYTIAKNMQASPKTTVSAGKSGVIALTCSVDSIMTRRGLQKAMESRKRQNLPRRDSKKLEENYSDVIKISGAIDFRLKAAGLEIPFSIPLPATAN